MISQVVQTHVKKIRLGMLHQPSKDEDNVQPAEEEDDREVERYGEGGGEDQEEVEDFFSNMAGRQVTDGLLESKMSLVRLIQMFSSR